MNEQQLTSFLHEIDERFTAREEQYTRSRNMWTTIAGLLLVAAISLGVTNITLVANHAVRISGLEERQREIWTTMTPWGTYIDYQEFMNLKYEVLMSMYKGDFPERFPELIQRLDNLEKSVFSKLSKEVTRGGKHEGKNN